MAFNSLSTSNLPDPGVDPNAAKEPRDYFETFLYTGNGEGLQVGDVIKKPADTTTISNSLIFNDGDSAYLSWTPSGAGTDSDTWTWSAWVKRANLSTTQILFAQGANANDRTFVRFESNDQIRMRRTSSGGGVVDWSINTNRIFKDTSRWYHIIIVYEYSASPSSDRVRLYIDGVRETDFVATPSYPDATGESDVSTTNTAYLGSDVGGGSYFDGYMAEVHLVDGTAQAPTDFGNFDANGIWIPKAVTGITYGTNGFYLDFADNTSTTTLGADQTANNNDWTLNNLATTDQVTDSPTNNFCTWSKYTPLTTYTTTLSEGNLTASYNVPTNTARINGSIGVSSGKWYYEFQSSAGDPMIGWCETNGDNAYVYDGNAANKRNYAPFNGSNTSSAYGATWTTTDVIGVALDLDNGTLTFYKNNTSQGIAYTGLSGTFTPTFGYQGGTTVTGAANFGQRGFTYTPPTGYLALSENNITVDDQNLESPDFVWIKNRSQNDAHHLYDSVRGIQKAIYSNANTAETAEPNGLLDFNKNGFTIGSEVEVNTANEDYVAWCWKANGATGVSNTNGSITSTVSANTTSGFSIVKYTGDSTGTDGTASTVGHGLSQAPEMIFFKPLDTYDGAVYHSGLTSASYRLILFSSSGTLQESIDTGFFNGTAPTSSVFSIGSRKHTNSNGGMIAYCFHSVDGFSKFGSYRGNGSTNGTFVYTGFRPAFWMMKSRDDATHWVIYDDARELENPVERQLLPNELNAEADSARPVDFLSNGVKLRFSTYLNDANQTYIYMAFAKNPFKYATAR